MCIKQEIHFTKEWKGFLQNQPGEKKKKKTLTGGTTVRTKQAHLLNKREHHRSLWTSASGSEEVKGEEMLFYVNL